MNNTTPLTMRGGTTAQSIDYLRATEYYLDRHGNRQDLMEWGGKWHAELGLAGKPVERQPMDRLAEGFHPTLTKKDLAGLADIIVAGIPDPKELIPLCQNAGAKPTRTQKFKKDGTPKLDKKGQPQFVERGGHRIGYDVTLSAPKDVSLAFQIAGEDERAGILECQKRAVRASMSYLETFVETRRGQGGKDVSQVDGLVWSSHIHIDARPDKTGTVNCAIHTHNLVYGICKGKDGKTATYDARELYEHRRASDAIYKSVLYAEMRKIGYKLEQSEATTLNGARTGIKETRLAGFTDQMIEYFSTRQGDILEYMEEHDVDKQTAWARTRNQKTSPSYEELSALWVTYLAEYFQEHPEEKVLTTEVLKNQSETLLTPADAADVITRMHATDALLERHHIMATLAEETMGRATAADLDAMTESAISNMVAVAPHAIHTDDAGQSLARRNTASRYAAPWMISQEKEVQEYARRRMSEDLRLAPDYVVGVIDAYQKRNGFTLSDEQRQAVMHVCCQSGGIAAMTGYAGSGKTTVAAVFTEAYRGQGYEIYGAAPSWEAAKKLEAETGIKSYSAAKLLQLMGKGQWEGVVVPAGRKSLIIVDEAGMCDSQMVRDLLVRTEAMAQAPKLLFQGDLRQIQPVGAGSGMALAMDVTGDVKLTEIRRQSGATPEETASRRSLAGSFYEHVLDDQGNVTGISDDRTVKSRAQTQAKGQRIVAGLLAADMIDEYTTKSEAMTACVEAWAESKRPVSEKMMITHKNVDVDALNAAARTALKQQGTLEKRDHSIRVKTKINGVEKFVRKDFSVGDQIKFQAKNDRLDVVNKTKGRIEKISPQHDGSFTLTVSIRSDAKDGAERRVIFNTSAEYNAITHHYARSIHDVQGGQAPEIYHLADAGMLDAQSSLVAFTRLTSGDYTMFADTQTVETLEDRLGIDRLKESALLAQGGAQGTPTARPTTPGPTAQRPAATTHPNMEPSAAAPHEQRVTNTQHTSQTAQASGGGPNVAPAHRAPPATAYSGELLQHGSAPYQHQGNGKMSYFLTLRSDDGSERTLWGKDLEQGLNESGAQRGERILIERHHVPSSRPTNDLPSAQIDTMRSNPVTNDHNIEHVSPPRTNNRTMARSWTVTSLKPKVARLSHQPTTSGPDTTIQDAPRAPSHKNPQTITPEAKASLQRPTRTTPEQARTSAPVATPQTPRRPKVEHSDEPQRRRQRRGQGHTI